MDPHPAQRRRSTRAGSRSYVNGKLSFTATRTADGVSWTLTDAPTDRSTVLASTDPAVKWPIEAKVSEWGVTHRTDYKNHGDYVSQQDGGADAAHSCIGMPINSNS